MSLDLEEVDPGVLEEIFSNFYDQEEYGDFKVAERNFREVDPDSFLKENENKNTKRKTESDLKLFMSFLMSKNESRRPEFIPPDLLNTYICEFILGVTKKDGSEYEPTTLRGFIGSIDRHLKACSSSMAIFKDREFSKARAVLTKKQQQLKGQGLGNKPKAAEALDETMINKMYASNTLGAANPRALLHSMWFLCTNHFGMRTGKECHDLCWGDIDLCLDESTGTEYLIYDRERQTKTRSGSNPRDTRGTKPTAHALFDLERDPVRLYKLYKEKRPSEMFQPDSPFFLTPVQTARSTGPWYKKSAMGINKLYSIMKEMKLDAGIENPRITPYSCRKHLVQTLDDAGVPHNHIVQITGHKNVNSINNYCKINKEQSKNISNILSNSNKKSDLELHVTGASGTSASSSGTGFESEKPETSRNMFANSHFHGNVTFNFNSKSVSETQSLSQMHSVNFCQQQVPGQRDDMLCSPVIGRRFKRIRMLPDSDSE